ncbi:MAG: dienelactone hydrolase family protein, partial [Roseimicrobium sp.]
ADPFVPAAEVAAFHEEMKAAGVKYELIAYPGAVHAFTQKAAGSDPSKGVAYDADADTKSWAAMQRFFGELFR